MRRGGLVISWCCSFVGRASDLKLFNSTTSVDRARGVATGHSGLQQGACQVLDCPARALPPIGSRKWHSFCSYLWTGRARLLGRSSKTKGCSTPQGDIRTMKKAVITAAVLTGLLTLAPACAQGTSTSTTTAKKKTTVTATAKSGLSSADRKFF